MRFRKSIKIGKGVRLNFSKSGMSLSAGIKGASFNFGPKGSYLNTSIPGTGLYDRVKLGSNKKYSAKVHDNFQSLNFLISLDDKGNPFIKYPDGNIINDEKVTRRIKKTNKYKELLNSIYEERKNIIENKTESFINIYKLCPSLTEEEKVIKELNLLKPLEYKMMTFTVPQPNLDSVKDILINESKIKIRSLAFWNLKRKRNEYVESNLSFIYDEMLNKWNKDKADHERSELEKKEEVDLKYRNEYKKRKNELEFLLKGSNEYVENQLNDFLTSIQLPVDFSVNYEYLENDGILLVDLNLPKIEDLPQEKASRLSSGKLKVKQKTQKEIKEEYIRCIIGLAFFFAGSFFNISTHMYKTLISGYVSRLSKKTGNIEDEYIYSINFNRTVFNKLNIGNIDPSEALSNFKHKIEVTKSLELITIQPFGKNEI